MKVFLFVLLFSSLTWAQSPESAQNNGTQSNEVSHSELKKQIDELTERLKILEGAPKAAAVDSTKPKVSFFGDLRLRQQNEKIGSADERRIQRLQLKLGAKIEFAENLQAYARLLTGSNANSGNVTMGDSKQPVAGRKSIGVDWAYLNYQPLSFLSLQGGKMPQPFYFVGKNQIIMDRDIAPEGWALKMPFELTNEWSLQILGLATWAVENYDSSAGQDLTDSFFNGVQAYAKWKRNDTSVILGLGTFSFTKIKDNEPKKFFGNSSDTSFNNSRGNSLVIDPFSGLNVYQYNYDLSEMFFEVKHKINDWELSVFQEKVENYDAHSLNKAFSFGLSAQYKKWSFTYYDQKLEKDSVFALFTDSDFANNTTSSKGSVLQLAYKATKDATVTLTQFSNKTDIDTLFPLKYKRTHLDVTLSF